MEAWVARPFYANGGHGKNVTYFALQKLLTLKMREALSNFKVYYGQ